MRFVLRSETMLITWGAAELDPGVVGVAPEMCPGIAVCMAAYLNWAIWLSWTADSSAGGSPSLMPSMRVSHLPCGMNAMSRRVAPLPSKPIRVPRRVFGSVGFPSTLAQQAAEATSVTFEREAMASGES